MNGSLISTQQLNRFMRMAVSSSEFQKWLTQVNEDKTSLDKLLSDNMKDRKFDE